MSKKLPRRLLALPVNNVMYGIYYNKILLEEHNWELPTNFAELEALCAEIKESGMDAHIAKPVQIDNLRSTIQQVLDSRLEQKDISP